MFPDKLCVSSFPDRFPHSAWTAVQSTHSDFVESRLYACLGVTCHLHLPGSFTCHCGNTGVERAPNKSQHTKLTLEKKILPPPLPGFELTTFRSRVRLSYQPAIAALTNQLSRLLPTSYPGSYQPAIAALTNQLSRLLPTSYPGSYQQAIAALRQLSRQFHP